MKTVSGSLRYDISLGMRLLRAIPVVLVYFGIAVMCFVLLPSKARDIPLESLAVVGAHRALALSLAADPLCSRFDLRAHGLSQDAI